MKIEDLPTLDWNPLATPEPPQTEAAHRVTVAADLFARSVKSETIRAVWDAMWQTPQHTFVVWASDVERARTWTERNACVRHFNWVHGGAQPPMKPGEIIHMDTLYGRGRCGWDNNGVQQNNGYGCSHPENNEDGSCFTFACPIAYSAGICQNCEKPEDDCTCDDYSENVDRLVLWRRPRYALARNVILGARIVHQGEAEGVLLALSGACAMERAVELSPGVDASVWIAERHARYARELKTSNVYHDARILWEVREGMWRRTAPEKKRRLAIVAATQ